MTWDTPVPILVFLGLGVLVLDLGPVYATDRHTDVRQHHHLIPLPKEREHNNMKLTIVGAAATPTDDAFTAVD